MLLLKLGTSSQKDPIWLLLFGLLFWCLLAHMVKHKEGKLFSCGLRNKYSFDTIWVVF